MSSRGGRGSLGRGASNAAPSSITKSYVSQPQPQTQVNPVASVPQPQAAPAVTSMSQLPPAAPISQTEAVNINVSDSDIPMPDIAMKGEDPEKPSWMKKRTKEEEKDNRPVKRRRKNAAIVKSCAPRSSIQVLNEIAMNLGVPLPVYENIRADEVGVHVDVMFQDVTHTGFGTDRSKAKQAGCEQHIRDIIRANLDKLDRGKKTDESAELSDSSENPSKKPRIEEDSTPWVFIYSFAMKKYLELMELGDDALSSPPNEDVDYSVMDERMPYQAPSRMPYQFPHRMPYQAPSALPQNNTGFSGYSKDGFGTRFPSMAPNQPAMGGGTATPKPQPVLAGARPFPAKSLPDNAVSMNAVMLLNQMRPDAVYSGHSDCGVAGDHRFKIVVRLDGESYEGFGSKVKEAKKAAAKRAILAIYGIECLGN